MQELKHASSLLAHVSNFGGYKQLLRLYYWPVPASLFPVHILEQIDDRVKSYRELEKERDSLRSTFQDGKKSPVYKAIEEAYGKDLEVS